MTDNIEKKVETCVNKIRYEAIKFIYGDIRKSPYGSHDCEICAGINPKRRCYMDMKTYQYYKNKK